MIQSTADSGKGINNQGVAAFTVSTAVCTWQRGVATVVPNLWANNGSLAINDLGHLAGAAQLRGYLHRDGVKTDLGTFGGYTFAQDLDNSDVVVGESYDYKALRYAHPYGKVATSNGCPPLAAPTDPAPSRVPMRSTPAGLSRDRITTRTPAA